MIEFDLNHLSIIVGLALGFLGIGAFFYKLLTWIYKVNTKMEDITRISKNIKGLLGSEGFDEDI